VNLSDDISNSDQHAHATDHADLWRAWQSHKDLTARDQLIEIYLPFARMLAAKLFGKRTYMELEFHDYFQHASIGLIEAIERFDAGRGIRFEPYASSRINGAILSGIETLSEKQEQVAARKRIVATRVDSLKNTESISTDSASLFANLAEIAIGLAMGFVLDDSGMYQQGLDATYVDNTYQRIELHQLRNQIEQAVKSLAGNEKLVISYHYLQHLPFDEIAQILGLSKGRVSQIHKAAIQHLREKLSRDGNLDLRC
jgi:RNA polymerase sigma factor for flagellar operon FliA